MTRSGEVPLAPQNQTVFVEIKPINTVESVLVFSRKPAHLFGG